MKGEILTGLLFIDEETEALHTVLNTTIKPLNGLKEKELNPGVKALAEINAGFR
jgi:2-oxoglutarate/2-oxoacid ferredoxin oxidoreductase subunit beta